MTAKTINQIVEHSKAAWGVSKLLSRLAGKVFSQLRTQRSYARQIKALQDERDTKLAKNKEEQEKLVEEMIVVLGGHKSAFARGLKSVNYAVGQVGFRQMKPAVELADGFTEQQLIEKLKHKKRSWLRETVALNKQKILQDYQDGKFKKVVGIQIRQGEEFFVSLAPRGKDKPAIITAALPKE